MTTIWVAGSDDEEAVIRLMLGFRDWWVRDWPDDERFAAGIGRLMGDPGTTFVLGAVEGEPAAGVCQLRFRYGFTSFGDPPGGEDLLLRRRLDDR